MAAAFIAAFLPSINIQLSNFYLDTALAQVSFVVFVQISCLFLFGAYSIIWRYISLTDLRVFAYAAMVSGGTLLGLRFLLEFSTFNLWQIPISVILIDTVLGFGGLLALRVIRRVVYEVGDRNRAVGFRRSIKKKRALFVGAGRTGATLAREIAGGLGSELDIWGFLDDDPQKKGGRVSGYKVLGSIHDLPHMVEEAGIKQVVITLDNADAKEIRRIVDICSELGVRTQIVPSLNELASGRVSVSRIRDVQIEDLLGRETVTLDSDNLSGLLKGKVVMVTGAGGSIGSELVRQIVNFAPAQLLLVERSEFFLFEIERELTELDLSGERVPLIADVSDEERMRQIFDLYRPHVVFHAAAHKHVSLMEKNAAEAVKNNSLATRTLGEIAGSFGASHFVLISTDKAVNPTSVMGASKRLAEIAIQDLQRKFSTRFLAVRFGNVLGSAGSVVPIFRDQIKKGGPVTVTHAEMTRYFMTIPEASQLVMQAAALGDGGEIFILDMGQPVKILELAEDMIRLSGFTPYEEIDITFSGIRKGEKLFEELEISGEGLENTRHPKIFIGMIGAFESSKVEHIFSQFKHAVNNNDEALVRSLFNRTLGEAKVAETSDTQSARIERGQSNNARTATPALNNAS